MLQLNGGVLTLLILGCGLNTAVEGSVVYKEFVVAYTPGSPDGVVKPSGILTANGQFPGPLIELNEGDTLNLKLTNLLQNGQRNTLHWHGIFQNGTPFQDGPEQVTQCGIPFGQYQTYRFQLNQAGTYWWHSHVKAQYTEGLHGPIVVHARREVYASDYDKELVILLSDWNHLSGQQNTAWFLSPASQGNEPIPDSILINGHGTYPCDVARSLNYTCFPQLQTPPVFKVVRGLRYRIRVINTSGLATYKFSIDQHSLTTIEVDGVDTVKVVCDSASISPAQRYSFIVTMNGSGSNYWIRSEVDPSMFNLDAPNINPRPDVLVSTALAKLQYSIIDGGMYQGCSAGAALLQPLWTFFGDSGTPPPLPPPNPSGDRELDENLLQPYDQILAPNSYNQQFILNVDGIVDAENVNHLVFNEIIYEPSPVPLLPLVIQSQPIPANVNPIHVGYNNVIEIVLNNHDTGSHPFHLHGHTFFVMGTGEENAGDYDPTSDMLIRNGVRRDTFVVQAGSWGVIRFVADNPGVWFFHCHIDWHLESGLAAVVFEAEDEIRSRFTIPNEARRVCHAAGITLP